jgi:hypothetical protein
MAVDIALAVLLVLLLALLREAVQILRAGPRGEPKLIRRGPPADPAAGVPPLPRVVWTYWNTLPAPAIVDQCLQNWRRFAPDHELRLLDRTTAPQWLAGDWNATAFAALPPYRQSDWLRLQLLKRHGGLWIDASTLLSADLGWVHRLHATRGGVVGFYIERYTTEPARPMLENWFIAAAAGDPFITAWADELARALALGEAGYIASLDAHRTLESTAQGIPAGMRAYLSMHLAASFVCARDGDVYPLTLLRAEDVAFAFHATLAWRKRHLYARLALTPAPRHVPALIKLRGGDRAVVEKGLAHGLWRRDSLLARLLELRP